jgi:hypothetical protein
VKRISEHKKDCTSVEQISWVTRATTRSSAMERNKSAIIDHAIQQNHVIDREGVKIVERAGHRKTRWIKEAVAIIRGGTHVMNRQEGQYELPEVYSALLTPLTTPSGVSNNGF